jgi:hypothetical protein
MTIVTKDSLQSMLDNPRIRTHVVGRALVVLFENQTKDEQVMATTNKDNGVGFTGSDAFSGTLTAKYYMKHGILLDWQVEKWTKAGKNGYARLCKYWRQLDTRAQTKAS